MKQWQKNIKWGFYFWVSAAIFTCFIYAKMDFARWPVVLYIALLWYFNWAILSFPLYKFSTKITFERFSKPVFFLIHFIGALIFAFLATALAFLDIYITPASFNFDYLNKFYDQYFHICTIVYLAFMSWFYFLQYMQKAKDQAVKAANLKQLAQESELKALKAQVNPHFLFNSLNSINSLVVKDPEKTREMVVALAETLRYVLDTSLLETATLDEEINFIKTYLAIEKIRFGDNLQLEFEIDPSLKKIMIPPVILQPLVENSIKHGISNKVGGGKISIHVSAKENEMICKIIDTGDGLDQEKINSQHERGIGIKNIKERLRMIYGDSFSFSIADNNSYPPKGCISTIKIPINKK